MVTTPVNCYEALSLYFKDRNVFDVALKEASGSVCPGAAVCMKCRTRAYMKNLELVSGMSSKALARSNAPMWCYDVAALAALTGKGEEA